MKTKQEHISDQLFEFQSKQIGGLEITSGNIIACDPLAGTGIAFEKKIAPGKYPVHVFFRDDDDDRTFSYAAIQLKDELWLPHTLVIATTPGQNADTLQEGEIFGYPVDAGMGCFADQEAFKLMEQNREELSDKAGDSGFNYYDDVVDKEMEEAGTPDLLDHKPYKDKAGNVIMFRSGHGDGVYATYWGYNKTGELSCLVTDFAVHSFSEAESEESYEED